MTQPLFFKSCCCSWIATWRFVRELNFESWKFIHTILWVCHMSCGSLGSCSPQHGSCLGNCWSSRIVVTRAYSWEEWRGWSFERRGVFNMLWITLYQFANFINECKYLSSQVEKCHVINFMTCYTNIFFHNLWQHQWNMFLYQWPSRLKIHLWITL